MNKKSCVYVVLAAILWGLIGIFFRELSAIGFSSMEIVAIRVIVSAIVMSLYLFVQDKRLLKISLKDSYLFVGTGILSLLFFNWCYFKTMEISTISVAAVLLYTSPIFVLILSAFLFKEKLTRIKVSALIMTFIGCILVTGVLHGGSCALPTLGIVTGLGSGFWYAMYSIFGRYALRKYNPLTVSAYTFIFAALGSIPVAGLHKHIKLFAMPSTLAYAFGIGVICCMLPFIFYTKGLQNLETSKAAIIATLEPVVATMVGMFVYKEPLTVYAFCGMVIIFSAIVLLNNNPKQEQCSNGDLKKVVEK